MAVIVKDLGIASAYGYAKSKGYTGTEEEFAELMASYADVAQQAEAAAQDAEDAKNEAVTAKTDAQTAKTAAQAAQSAAETASGTASAKASEAAQSAQSAAVSASAAQTSATAASGSAQTAQTAAQTATAKASEASSSASAASTAKTGAETARTGAQTAQTAAETAQANAETAASSVSASAAQIEQNTEDITGLKNDFTQLEDKVEDAYNAYVTETETGSIASFTDGADGVPVKDLTVAIEPVQDLHGYDNPWPAGGGKNLIDPSTCEIINTTIRVGFTSGYVLTAGVVYTFSSSQTAAELSIQDFSTGTKLVTKYSSTSVSYTPIADTTVKLEVYFSTAPSGGIDNVKLQLEVGSTASAWTPYSNICPISGWTGANVTRTGKNLYDLSKQVVANNNTNTFLIIDLKHNTDYVFSTNKQIAGLYINYSDNETCPDATGYWSELDHVYSATSLAFNSGSHKWYKLTTYEGSIQDDRTYQLEFGSTASAYEPFVDPETVSISWQTEAGTVYGGTLDVTTGVLTIDTARYKFTGSEAYTQLSGSVAIKTGLVLKSTGDGYCTDFEFNGTGSTNFIYLKTTLTAEDLKTYMGNHDVYAVVVLAQAQTYQLTAHEVSTILGQNNIFADTGNSTVQYRADTKLYIDKVLNA